jgi:hypothetical protein
MMAVSVIEIIRGYPNVVGPVKPCVVITYAIQRNLNRIGIKGMF